MRLLSYSNAGVHSFGLLTTDGDGVIDLGRRLPDVADLGALLAADLLPVVEQFTGKAADYSLDEIGFDRLLPWPRKIYCVGVNYVGRNEEYRDGKPDGQYPSLFVRFPDSFVGHQQHVIRPHESVQFDCEGEIVIVIGRAGRRIAVDDTRSHIAGLSLANDGTLRDWVAHARFNVTQGKHFDSSGSMGPWLVTIDEFGDLGNLELRTRINGELIQDGTTATMQYPIEYLVSYVSTWARLEPGDVILSGTPLGTRGRRDPPIWLVPGDQIEITVDEIGTLRNTVAAEAPTSGAVAAET